MDAPALLPSRLLDDKLWASALLRIPNGTQTLSKCPDRYVNGVYPKLLKRGDGCEVVGMDERRYIDFICGLGPIILGYNNAYVNQAVMGSIRSGQVLLSLPHPDEATLADLLSCASPSWQMSKFYKTGSDALTAAVKVARAYTGKLKVAVCGYHGWHDWYTIANEKKAGIPPELGNHVAKFKYNDLESLEAILKSGDCAAVVMEPVVYDAPKGNFLAEVARLAREHGAVLVFDEVVTGFRFGLGGAGQYFGVEPDLTCLSKAMGNGFAVAALCGKREIMRTFERDDFFVSGTFGGDLVGISAAMATMLVLRMHDNEAVKNIWKMGQRLQDNFNTLCWSGNLEAISCTGFPPRTMFNFPSAAHKALFWQECIKRDVLFGYANFITAAHTNDHIEKVIGVMAEALQVIRNHYEDPKAVLEGDVPVEVFRLVR